MTRTMIRSLLLASAFGLVLLGISGAQAYERYKVPGTNAGNCSTCHGDFTDGTSPQGTVFPRDDKHAMHRSKSHMYAECDLCHTSGDNKNPFIGSSDGTDANPGLGCVGCHGRVEDAGHDGRLPGLGAGLRQHHFYGGP